MENIIWKPVIGYEGLYEVSNTGLVKSLNCYNYKHPRIMKLGKRADGYLSVGLSKNNKTKTKTVHRLVAEAFIPNPNNLEMVNHKDENKSNNNVDNLEWCTRSYNQLYSIKKHPERRQKFYKNFLDKNGKSTSPMVISKVRKRTEPIAHLNNELEIIKIYNNWIDAKNDLKYVTADVLQVCKRNINRMNTEKKNHIRKHYGEIFVFLNDEIININQNNKTILRNFNSNSTVL